MTGKTHPFYAIFDTLSRRQVSASTVCLPARPTLSVPSLSLYGLFTGSLKESSWRFNICRRFGALFCVSPSPLSVSRKITGARSDFAVLLTDVFTRLPTIIIHVSQRSALCSHQIAVDLTYLSIKHVCRGKKLVFNSRRFAESSEQT